MRDAENKAIEIWIIHPNGKAIEDFKSRFSELPSVRFLQNRFEELPPHDCFVTAGNSYGIMTAGIDAAVIHFHGKWLMATIQKRILDEYLGEQPIGTAFIQSTRQEEYPYIIHAPTMRTPGSIEGTDRVYCATWAALIEVHRHNRSSKEPAIRSIVFPAMGAGFGMVSFSESARQMAAACSHFFNPPRDLNWDVVAERQRRLVMDGEKRLKIST